MTWIELIDKICLSIPNKDMDKPAIFVNPLVEAEIKELVKTNNPDEPWQLKGQTE